MTFTLKWCFNGFLLVPFIRPGYVWLVTHYSTLLYSFSTLPSPFPSPFPTLIPFRSTQITCGLYKKEEWPQKTTILTFRSSLSPKIFRQKNFQPWPPVCLRSQLIQVEHWTTHQISTFLKRFFFILFLLFLSFFT